MTSATYQLEVEGVGVFEVRRRNMRVTAQVGAEFNRLTEGQTSLSPFFGQFCDMFATLKVLIVSGPDGWDLDNLDPDDPDSFELMGKVYGAIKEKEAFFRSELQARRQEPRA